jgi:cyclopropane fatty-acyl-phospholipid synthase-like methyltransferase
MNFFDNYLEFIEVDPRKDRGTTQVTSESMSKRCEASLPAWLIKDKTILDLGSCFGAYGHWALTHGAKHYTGVELQKQFSEKSIQLLSKHHDESNYSIVTQDAFDFVKDCSSFGVKYDIVIASGLIHGYLDVISLLEKISAVSAEYVIIESLEIEEPKFPAIEFKPYRMVMPKLNDNGNYRYYQGYTPIVGFKALTFLLNEYGFSSDGARIKPDNIVTTYDLYNKESEGSITPNRYIGRFKRSTTNKVSLQDHIESNKGNLLPKIWEFDQSVASRFQNEARTNIPDYDRVISMCLQIANKKLDKTSSIIDIGSALGHTMDVFIKDGFTNVTGVDNSSSMIQNSLYPSRVTLSDKLPEGSYDMIVANWTLHFVQPRHLYLDSIYNSLTDNGVLVLSDKTLQSDLIEEMYYDFKRECNVSEEYIQEKKKQLNGYMFPLSVDWYMKTLESIGFKNIQIINSRLGFVTFYAEK